MNAQQLKSGRKNIILRMTDQHRVDHVGYAGRLGSRLDYLGGRLETPNNDRIAGSVGSTSCRSVNPCCTLRGKPGSRENAHTRSEHWLCRAT